MKNWLRGRSYSFSIPFGMIFRRMHCCRCGEKLKRKFMTVAYDPENKSSKYAFFSGTSIGVSNRYHPDGVEYKECFYICNRCGYAISYNDQKVVADYQREPGRKILTKKEKDFLNHAFENKF